MKRCRRRFRKGFTLVEILLVVIMIGILAGMFIPSLAGRAQEARITRSRADIQGQLSLALDMFEQDVGRYPTSEEGLQVLVTNAGGVANWKGPYLKDGLKKDPWGSDYSYVFNSDANGSYYVVTSPGPDKQLGSSDDIANR
jgi:general secretion pathway protein G